MTCIARNANWLLFHHYAIAMETFTENYLNSAKILKIRIPDNTKATYHRVIGFHEWGQLYDQNSFLYTFYCRKK